MFIDSLKKRTSQLLNFQHNLLLRKLNFNQTIEIITFPKPYQAHCNRKNAL